MISVEQAPDDLYNLEILMNGKINTYPIYILKKWMHIPVADIEHSFHEQGIKDARVLSLTKIKEIIQCQ